MALNSFNKYILEQGVSKDDIKNKRVLKDFLRDGYVIEILYKSEPNLTYEYKWFFNHPIHKKTYNIYLIVFDEKNNSTYNYKYLRLRGDR